MLTNEFTFLFCFLQMFSISLLLSLSLAECYLYPSFVDVYNNAPYYSNFVNYQYIPPSPDYSDDANFKSRLNFIPPLNILPKYPSRIATDFTVVPLVVVTQENLRALSDAEIIEVSKINPTMKVKVSNSILDCTPAVNVTLDKPLIVFSLRTSIAFPTSIEVTHRKIKIPLNVGAVIAPVSGGTFVSPDTPISVQTVFAVPTHPFQTIDSSDQQSVAIDSASNLQPYNVTLLNFPENEAEPLLQVDDEDDELGWYQTTTKITNLT